MADSILSIFVNKLGPLIVEEAKFFRGVEKELIYLYEELEWIKSFLRAAEPARRTSHLMNVCVTQIIDTVYDAEDVIDSYMLYVERQRGKNFILKILHYLHERMRLQQLREHIQEINARVQRISTRRSIYNVDVSATTHEVGPHTAEEIGWRRSGDSTQKEFLVVGLKKEKEKLAKWLKDEQPLCRKIISITGMGGQGKTALARATYNTKDVSNDFPARAWITVSQRCDAKDCFLGALKELKIDKLRLTRKEDFFVSALKELKVDGSSMTSEKAEQLSRMLRRKIGRSSPSPEEDKAITDMLCMVCRKADGSGMAPKDAEGLSDMLCEKITGNGLTTAEAEALSGMDCEGLRLKLYQMLKNKKYLVVIDDIWKVEDWERICGAFPDEETGSRIVFTTRHVDVVKHVDQPGVYHLQLRKLDGKESWDLFKRKVFSDETCPQELVVNGQAIVKKCGGLSLAILGMAGVVMRKERTEAAWKKVLDSASWQLSQDSSPWREVLSLSYYDLPEYLKACFLYFGLFPEDYDIDAERLIWRWVAEGFIQPRGDETMEDVAEELLEELIQRNMVQVKERAYRGGPVTKCGMDNLQRNLAISKAKEDRFMDIHANRPYFTFTASKLRRLAIHSMTGSEQPTQVADTTPNLRSLLVLKGEFKVAAYLKSLTSPTSAKILRVLDLEGVKTVMDLPVEIGKLRLLHYLGLAGTEIKIVPSSMRGLVKLQTLILNLQEPAKITSLLDTILNLKSLRHFHLISMSSLEATPPFVSLGDTKHVSPVSFGRNLLSLKVKSNMWMYMSDVLMRAGCLRKLHLQGRLEAVNCLPSSLVELHLIQTFLNEDPLAVLGEGLPKLKQLHLNADSFIGKVLHFSQSKFPQLECLHLIRLRDLIEWTMQGGALPSLKHLEILHCEKLKQLPDTLGSVTGLQEVRIETSDPEFLESLQYRGASWEAIQHVHYKHIPELPPPNILTNILSLIGGVDVDSICKLQSPPWDEAITAGGTDSPSASNYVGGANVDSLFDNSTWWGKGDVASIVEEHDVEIIGTQ